MTIRTTTPRKLFRAFALALFVAALALPAWAGEKAIVLSKDAGSKVLTLEEGVKVQVSDSTQIHRKNGDRAAFADIPNPEDVDPMQVAVDVEGPKGNGQIKATKIVFELLVD